MSNSKQAFVYLALQVKTGLHKIGFGICPEFRMKQLKQTFGSDFKLIHKIPCSDVRKVERKLHGIFNITSKTREMARLTDSEIEWIKQQTELSILTCKGVICGKI